MPPHLSLPALLLSLLTLGTATTHARLGETPEECRTRYGDPLPVALESGPTVFHFRGLLVAIEFTPDATGQRRAASICYRRTDLQTFRPTPLESREITALLHINGAADWPERKVPGYRYYFVSPSGDLACYIEPDQILIIETVAGRKLREQTQERRTKEALSGF